MIENNFFFYLFLSFINCIFIYFYKNIASFLNLYDNPDFKRKIHIKPVPLLGGIIILYNFTISIIYILLFKDFDQLQSFAYLDSFKNFAVFLFVFFSLFIVGLLDDKFFLSPIKKFFILIILISLIGLNDSQFLIDKFILPINIEKITFSQISFLFSIGCYVFLIISLNMYDGINLQSSIFYFLNFGFLFLYTDCQNIILFSLLIGILAFSILNTFNKSFLGDSGVFILAFLLGYFYVKIYNNTELFFTTDIIIFLFLPIIDSLRLLIERQYKNKPIFLPDQNHFHHLLLKKNSFIKTVVITSIFVLTPHLIYLSNLNSLYSFLILIIFFIFILKIIK